MLLLHVGAIYAKAAPSSVGTLIDKYMHLLGIRGDKPTVKIQDNLGSRWLGKCEFWPSKPGQTTITLQQSILNDPQTLERVLAHEMVHHAVYLDYNVVDIEMAKRGLTPGHAGHGEDFLAGAAKINAVMGPNFVTEKSDSSYMQENTREYFLLIVPVWNNRLGYAWSAKIGPKAQLFVDKALREDEHSKGGRLVRSTDIRWTNGAKIKQYGGYSIPKGPDDQERLRKLYESAPAPKTAAAKPARGTWTGDWYHGDANRRSTFSDQEMDHDNGSVDGNAIGPGIYWTRDPVQARGYAHPSGYVYTATMKTSATRILHENTKATRTMLAKFLDAAPEESRQYGLTNWDENPVTARQKALQAYLNSSTAHEALISIYHDFYGHEYNLFAKAMTALGFDAFLHALPGVDHLIIYNPAVIRITREAKLKKPS